MNSSNSTLRNPSNNSFSKYLILGGWTLLFGLVCFFIATSMLNSPNGTPNNKFNDNNLSESEVEVTYKPKIFNSSTFLVVNKNDQFSLYCFVSNLPRAVPIIWKKINDGWIKQVGNENTVIAISSQIIDHQFTDKASVVISNEGSKLTINPASNTDSGLYECSIAIPDDSPSIRYNVEVIN